MSSKRQLDDPGNSVAKRQHLDLLVDRTNSASDFSTTSEKARYEGYIDFTPQSNQPNGFPPICYGTLCEVQAKSAGSLDAESTPHSNGSHRLVTRDPDFFLFHIHVHDDIQGFAVLNANTFVMIDLITAKKLDSVKEQDGVFIKAVVESKAVKRLSSRSTKPPFKISVNIYGYESDARNIGQQLSKVGAFLQHPFHLEEGVEYLNPQFFDPQDGSRYMTHLVGIGETKFQARAFSDVVEGVLSSLDNGLPNLGINDPEIILTDDLITPLQEHFVNGSLRIHDFHGDSRSTETTSLMNHDIVLTTFATLVSDCKRRKVLQNVEWFRVVLDEAHWIRNPSSKQFKAVDSLVTVRRWCLSGTPIQNCINDLVSLLRFLKFEPFSNMDVFRQYILEPLRAERLLDSTNPLQMLLQSVCLRRTEKYLNLPAAHYELVTLSLHHDEQKLYSDVFRKYRAELDDLVSSLTKMDKKKATLRFSMISELRRLCNHGTLLEPPKTLDGATLNASCDYCNAAEKDNMAKLNGDTICPKCQRSLSPSTPSHSDSRSQSVQLSSLVLTLTVATQVHIIEPQWNPSVEEQAIARALRMGQSKTVKVFRYIMKDTVEEVKFQRFQPYSKLVLRADILQRILALQKKKKDLVKFTIDGNSRDGVSGTLEVMQFLSQWST
ncbi:hypothetical protein HYE68_008730 [Fusarium pseudograminearum]|nr:hypothetical protein HYE68_008730 [Fusarium pseudograminearum]